MVVEEDGGADLSLKVSCAGVRETLEGGGRLVFRDLRLFFEALSAEDSRIRRVFCAGVLEGPNRSSKMLDLDNQLFKLHEQIWIDAFNKHGNLPEHRHDTDSMVPVLE